MPSTIEGQGGAEGARALAAVRACVFDAYGTLFDTSSAATGCAEVPTERKRQLAALWRDKQLQYTWLRCAQGRHADFEQVTAEALEFALDTLEISRALAATLLARYDRLEVFEEVPRAIQAMGESGLPLAVLSNGTPRMLEALLANAGMRDRFSFVLSVQAAGAFKPSPRVYQSAVDALGLHPSRIGFVSSNGWDAHAAAAFGMTVVWCNRSGQRDERLPGRIAATIQSLDELPPLLAR
jgi:2-haloacid dehalogenase